MINLSLTQLQYLLEVHRQKNFSQAAKNCHVSQPTLSMQVQKAEEVLGIEVFDRSKKQALTTPQGLVLLVQIERVIQEFAGIESLVLDFKEGLKGELRLAIIPTLAPYLLPQFLSQFLKSYPELNLQSFEIQTHRILEDLKDDKIDVGILALPVEGPFESVELFEDRFFIYLNPQHELLKKTKLSLKDLPEKELIVLSEGHCLRDQILDVCSKKTLKEGRLSLEVGSLESLIRMVDQSQGITLLPELATHYLSSSQKQRLRPLIDHKAHRTVGLVFHRRYLRKKVISALLESLRKARPL